jgi:hypothetical protein
MAGTIIADFIRTDANRLSLQVGNTTFASINAMGLMSNTGTTIIAANGVIPSTSLPANSVLQVVQSRYSGVNASMAITTSGTMVATGFTVSITPIKTSSKILLFFFGTWGSTSSNAGVGGSITMYQSVGGGAYSSASGMLYNNYWNTIATYIAYQQLAFTMIDLFSPATTSTIIYQPYFNLSCGTAGGFGVIGGRNTDGGSQTGVNLIAMEIAG